MMEKLAGSRTLLPSPILDGAFAEWGLEEFTEICNRKLESVGISKTQEEIKKFFFGAESFGGRDLRNLLAAYSVTREDKGSTESDIVEIEPWYARLVEDCKDIFTETGFTSRWATIEGYHQVGKRILAEHNSFERAQIYGQEITTRVSLSLGKNIRTIERAIQFARKYPDLNLLPVDKNISWHKICNVYLPEPSTETELAEPKLDWGKVTEIGAILVTDPAASRLRDDTVDAVLGMCSKVHDTIEDADDGCDNCPDGEKCRQAFDMIC